MKMLKLYITIRFFSLITFSFDQVTSIQYNFQIINNFCFFGI
ncbi:Uncharacterised protein [Capnocytophaga sputigena]|uniref:Uncharacterized protein n=1 Tax=Capnocytophaga sputigena TaxID=1019 RepID=A0AAX2IE62_CAPSP|nr:Uncharacterised protein [Capnocytophaga sputigena]